VISLLRFKRGNVVDLPIALAAGEPAFTLDTHDLYIGDANGTPVQVTHPLLAIGGTADEVLVWSSMEDFPSKTQTDQELHFAPQLQSTLLAGPVATTPVASVGPPTFRALVNSDLPEMAVRIVTDTTTEQTGDDLIVCNKGTTMTVNLLAATGSGRRLIIKNINAGVVTVDGVDSETIDGETTQTLAQWEALQIIDYASGAWVIV
jgi:hypothetical protein